MNLQNFFKIYPKVAVAFSGGVDSSYLLYMAKMYAKEVCAYYVKGEFQPEFEYKDAKRLIEQYDIAFRVLPVSVLSYKEIADNFGNRCYYCKKVILEKILEKAKEDGFSVLLDGTNASDAEDDRPGMRALHELSVRSPLRECGLTKEQVRRLSKEVGLFTWDKPAYACLATRIVSGEKITLEKLQATERAEHLLYELGLSDFRVRCVGDTAKIQVLEDQLPLIIQHRKTILETFKNDYKNILLDLEVRG